MGRPSVPRGRRCVALVGAGLCLVVTLGAVVVANEVVLVGLMVLDVLLLLVAFPTPITLCAVGAFICGFVAWANDWRAASIIPSVLGTLFLVTGVTLLVRRSTRRGEPARAQRGSASA